MALRRFTRMRGTPSKIWADNGEQLVAASKQLGAWDFNGVLGWARTNGTEWHLVPMVGQHFNGHVECMISIPKRQMQRSFEGKRNSLEGVCMLLQETGQIVNSRLPVGRG